MRIGIFLCLTLFVACQPKEKEIARVGSVGITETEFRRKLSEVSEDYQSYVLTPHGRRQFLDVLIREKLMLAAAEASDIKKGAEFRTQMERLRTEERERMREGRAYLLTNLWIEALRKGGILKVSEQEARDYHRKHPTEVRVRHILLADSSKAESLAKRVRRGANFGRLARKESLDAATASDEGRMQPALYGEIIPDLEDVVFRMKVGEVGGPIRSKFGYHVLKKDSAKKISFEKARGRVERLLEKQKLDNHLQSIQAEFPVEVLDEQFQ